jgi:cell division protein FtsW (lipid II flippase)
MTAWLMLLPSAIFGSGIALAAVTRRDGFLLERTLLVPMVLAAVAPLVAFAALGVVAPTYDRILVATAATLTGVGTTTLGLIAAAPGADRLFYASILARHGLFVAGGFVALVAGAIAAKHVDRMARYPYSLVLFALLLTTVTVVAGETVNGARLWLRLGPIRFQPSEIARLCLAAFVATYLYDRRHLVGAPWRVRSLDLPPAPYLLPLGAAVLAAVGVLVLQNDLGMSALVALGALAALLSVQHARSFVVTALVFLMGAMLASYVAVPRVRDRVEGWVDPWHDPAGSGFQFVQADFGLAGGGITGQTSPLATPHVPELHTDLILVAIGSELGVVVAVAVLTLSGLLVCRCVAAALRAADGFRSLLGLSLAALIGIQVLLIAGGTLRVLPLTGLTYPLVSYGGTSMVVTLFALGAIVEIGASGETRD